MYNRYRYGRNNWYMAFFWAFVGFVLGQLSPRISFSLDERTQRVPSTKTTTTQQEIISHDRL